MAAPKFAAKVHAELDQEFLELKRLEADLKEKIAAKKKKITMLAEIAEEHGYCFETFVLKKHRPQLDKAKIQLLYNVVPLMSEPSEELDMKQLEMEWLSYTDDPLPMKTIPPKPIGIDWEATCANILLVGDPIPTKPGYRSIAAKSTKKEA